MSDDDVVTANRTRALVVYESMFGNTMLVAAAVARGLARSGVDQDVIDLAETTDPPSPPAGYDLLVVGAPTHAFSLSRTSSRRQAVEQGAPADRAAHGLREWLASLPRGGTQQSAATFDTRVATMRHLPGSAAVKAARLLRRHGHHLQEPPRSFYVSGTEGPLVDGELARAEDWGASLGSRLLPPGPASPSAGRG